MSHRFFFRKLNAGDPDYHEHIDSVFVFRASLEVLLKEWNMSYMLIRDPPTCFEKGSEKDLCVLKQPLGLEQPPFNVISAFDLRWKMPRGLKD
jgi:hypothetical protein